MSAPHPVYPHVFTPLPVGRAVLPNRIVVSGHFAGWWVDRGLPSDAFVAYLEERARGGVGLFVIGATSPMPGSGWMENVSDAIVPRYRALAEAGHRHGTKVFAQLCHPGFKPLPGVPIIEDAPAAGSEAVRGRPIPARRHIPSADELAHLAAAFGAAAGRAAEGGVDGLELHAHESFLHAQFLNPLWNTRDDAYGGSLENRLRFVLETLAAMRAAIGDLPLGLRLKGDDMAQRGMAPEEVAEALRILEASGLIDYVNVTGGDGRYHHGPTPRPEGEWLPLMARLRPATSLVTMHAGRIVTLAQAEAALASGAVDALCMTKAHICDPHHVAKARDGREAQVRVCTRCLQSCHGAMERMTCVYNPVTSREGLPGWGTLIPAAIRRRVVVVGAGPAGMEAALTAAARGHAVTVLERDDRVGGQVNWGSASPLRAPWGRIADYYARMADQVDLRLGVEATRERVLALEPDVVVVATGSTPLRLDLPGGPAPATVLEALGGALDHCRRVVVFDREGSNRAHVATDRLSDRGIGVVFATALPQVRGTGDSMLLDEFVHRFAERGVVFVPGVELGGWDGPGRLVLRRVETGEEEVLEGIDGVVAAVGNVPENALAASLRGAVPALHVIGDANMPQTVEAATFQGARLARRL